MVLDLQKIIPIVSDSSLTTVSLQSLKQEAGLGQLPPLSLYVHVPWCVRKCPYCDFNSHAQHGELPESEYLDALELDLNQSLELVWGRRIGSIFIGGGTPSLLSAQAVERLLMMIRARLTVLPDAEITLEANPGTVEATRFEAYAQSGVNRLSLGIQSFNDTALRAIGRVHDAGQAKQAIEVAQRYFQRVNLDLMFALPGQTLATLRDDVQTALAFKTGHLSLYHLTLEPNTVFAKYPPSLPDDDTAFAMQDYIHEQLEKAGYEHYEVSAYAQAYQRAQHNVNYWEFGDYLGIGPGAHSKLSFHDRIIRQARVKQPDSWMQRTRTNTHIAEHTTIDSADLPFEFMLNALRLIDGVPSHFFQERTGLPLSVIQQPLTRAMDKGLLTQDVHRICATELGQRFLNDVQTLFLSER